MGRNGSPFNNSRAPGKGGSSFINNKDNKTRSEDRLRRPSRTSRRKHGIKGSASILCNITLRYYRDITKFKTLFKMLSRREDITLTSPTSDLLRHSILDITQADIDFMYTSLIRENHVWEEAYIASHCHASLTASIVFTNLSVHITFRRLTELVHPDAPDFQRRGAMWGYETPNYDHSIAPDGNAEQQIVYFFKVFLKNIKSPNYNRHGRTATF